MKLYGIDVYGKHHITRGCCPGHDLFPRETYRNRRSVKAHRRDTKLAHRLGRHIAKNKIRAALKRDDHDSI
jgi:hypothetical protein